MTIAYSEPDPVGPERARISKHLRDLATDIARLRTPPLSVANREEVDHGPQLAFPEGSPMHPA